MLAMSVYQAKPTSGSHLICSGVCIITNLSPIFGLLLIHFGCGRPTYCRWISGPDLASHTTDPPKQRLHVWKEAHHSLLIIDLRTNPFSWQKLCCILESAKQVRVFHCIYTFSMWELLTIHLRRCHAYCRVQLTKLASNALKPLTSFP